MPWTVGRGLLRGDVSERYLDPRNVDISVFKSSSSTSVNRMSYLFGDIAFGSTSRGRISHREGGEEWKLGEEDDGEEDNGEEDNGEEDIAWEGSEGLLRVGARGFRAYASVVTTWHPHHNMGVAEQGAKAERVLYA